MKKIVLFILIFFNHPITAQTETDIIERIKISYTGDSTLLDETYEVYLDIEKVYYNSPIMNYLHIKGEKLRTKIAVNKHVWPALNRLTYTLYELKGEAMVNNEKPTYFIIFSKDNIELKRINFYSEKAPIELKKIFDIIRS